MPPARFIRLKPEEDARLREIEQDAHLRPKVRLRAQVLRLSSRGETMQGIAAYTNRSPASIGRDLDRWEGHGLEGLADNTAPGNPTRVTEEVKIFMEEKLAQERTWNARQLAKAVEGRFGIGVEPKRSVSTAEDGLLVEAHPLRALQTSGPRKGARSPRRAGGAKKGASEGEIVLKYLDQSGVSLCLPPAYSWTKKGRSNRHEVRSRWGKQGRINLIGTLSLDEEVESLEYRILEGSCRSGEVLGYLDSLTQEAERKGRRVVVVLDNAPLHKAGAVRDARPGWRRRARAVLPTGVLPAPEPHRGVWKRLKGSLMPRRYYDSLAELKQAVLNALRLLGAVELQC